MRPLCFCAAASLLWSVAAAGEPAAPPPLPRPQPGAPPQRQRLRFSEAEFEAEAPLTPPPPPPAPAQAEEAQAEKAQTPPPPLQRLMRQQLRAATEKAALLRFRAAGDPSNTLASWLPALRSEPCAAGSSSSRDTGWYRVMCDGPAGNVTYLSLPAAKGAIQFEESSFSH